MESSVAEAKRLVEPWACDEWHQHGYAGKELPRCHDDELRPGAFPGSVGGLSDVPLIAHGHLSKEVVETWSMGALCSRHSDKLCRVEANDGEANGVEPLDETDVVPAAPLQHRVNVANDGPVQRV